ncbi:chromosome partition protein Smc [Rubritalea halochordaticola]|uniref:Chromosome partition protein Smc n=1 Tax=Rubritalea halochordaticola TaxID=714537 RepID=A0ABP9V1T5_9BACT
MPVLFNRLNSIYLRLIPAALISSALAQEKITYQDHVLPILENSCTNCHNPDKKKGGLDLSSYSAAMAGGSGGKIADAGDGASSRIFLTSTHSEEPFMPPKGEKLSKKETDLIRAWIDGGLLETKNSKAKKSDTPKISFSQVDTGKPDGPPPLPEHVLLEPVITPEHSTVVRDIASSPWAPLVAITSQRQVLLYNTDTLRLAGVLPFPQGQPDSLSFHPSGKFLTVGGGVPGKSGTTITYSITNGQPVMQIAKEYDSVISTSIRPDMKAIATGGPSRLIKIWQTATNSQEHSIKKHTDWVTALAYSPDGILLASADRNGGLWVWEAHSGNLLHTLRGHQDRVTALRWSADGNFLASASEDGTLRFWDMRSGKEIKKLEAHKAGILDFDWARDGHILSVGRDHMIKLWTPDYKLVKQIEAKESVPTQATFSHDAKRFITSDYAGRLSVWDSKTHQVIASLSSIPAGIAQRLENIRSQINKLPNTIQTIESKNKELSDKFKQLQTNCNQSKELIAKNNRKREELKKAIERHNHQVRELNETISKLDDERKLLLELRKNTRTALQDHRKQLSQSQKDCDQAKHKREQANNHISQLKADLEKLKEASANESDNSQLTEKIAAKSEQISKRESEFNELKTQEKSTYAKHDSLVKLTPKIEQSSKDTESKWQATVPSWEKLTNSRREINEALKQAHASLKTTQEIISKTQKALPNLEKQLEQTKTEQHKIVKELENTRAKQHKLQEHEAFLVSASINTDRLRAKNLLDDLTAKQLGLMNEFSEFSKSKQPDTQTLFTLRKQIDDMALSCQRAREEYLKLDQAYFSSLKN